MPAESSTIASAVLASTIEEYQAKRQPWEGARIALVPTMGALHEGHLSLIRLARQHADRVVVSIFVNPLQFGPNEDFSRYPRTLASDLAACEHEGVDIVYAPDVREIYPKGMEETTQIVPPTSITDQLCGLGRPGHFTGVATVVHRLFRLVKPNVAVFGEKDAQQLAVIEAMVEDLGLPVQITPHPIVREADGLAMSSRNQYLETPSDRLLALTLSKTLFALKESVVGKAFLPAYATCEDVLGKVLADISPEEQGRFSLEYLLPVIPEGFQTTVVLKKGFKLLMAAKIRLENGQTVRLIDNVTL